MDSYKDEHELRLFISGMEYNFVTMPNQEICIKIGLFFNMVDNFSEY